VTGNPRHRLACARRAGDEAVTIAHFGLEEDVVFAFG
jgi:hypothetical protein